MSSKEKLESVKKQIEVIKYKLNSWQTADYRRNQTLDQLQAKRDKLISLRDQQLQATQAVHDEKMTTGLHATRKKLIPEGFKSERAKIDSICFPFSSYPPPFTPFLNTTDEVIGFGVNRLGYDIRHIDVGQGIP